MTSEENELEQVELLQEEKELLVTIRRFLIRFAIVVTLIIIVVGVSVSFSLSRQSDALDEMENNVNGNTENINKFGAKVEATKKTLEEAIKAVEERGADNDGFTQRIEKGLEQIDKLCQQTECEG